MARILLWIFVIVQATNIFAIYMNDEKTDWLDILPMWVVIAILAICESIEKAKEVK